MKNDMVMIFTYDPVTNVQDRNIIDNCGWTSMRIKLLEILYSIIQYSYHKLMILYIYKNTYTCKRSIIKIDERENILYFFNETLFYLTWGIRSLWNKYWFLMTQVKWENLTSLSIESYTKHRAQFFNADQIFFWIISTDKKKEIEEKRETNWFWPIQKVTNMLVKGYNKRYKYEQLEKPIGDHCTPTTTDGSSVSTGFTAHFAPNTCISHITFFDLGILTLSFDIIKKKVRLLPISAW